MGRPRTFDRAEAVEAVMNEIWLRGYEASSAKGLSEQLGISRSSFYNAFQSREELFLEALDLYLERSPDAVLDDIPPDASILCALTSMFREICRVRAADEDAKGCLAVNSLAELVGADETLGPVVAGAFRRRLDRLESLLRRAAARGELNDSGDLPEKALALKNLLVGLNLMSKVVRDEGELWAIARQTLKGLDLYRE